ncbi:MAG TPA: hypothetical protein VIC28_17260 [Thermoanaerobaculia bacterium]|jgi:hypothetical protein
MIAERAYVQVEAPEPTAAETQSIAPVQWGLIQRIAFRFVCCYFFLYIFPFPLEYIPFVDKLGGPYQNLLHALATWVGKHVFGVEITVFTNGSGDTTYDYVVAFCFAVLAAAAALVWTLLDRKRAHYTRLHEWLRIYVRFFLAVSMVSYGAFKVLPSQFPSPSLDRLLQPFGDASPMGLLWTFIGASRAYEFFSGAAEMLGGLLLLGRRTALLGALVCIGVVGNIVMLNFCYDVPVKLYSSHLLLMAVFLVLPDARRLANFFLFNRPAEPAAIRPLFRNVWLNRGALALRTFLLLGITGLALTQSYEGIQEYGDQAPKPPLYGIWNVDELTVDGQARPPLLTDDSRWRRVIFDYPQTVSVQLMSQRRVRYGLELDLQKQLLKLTKRDDPKWKAALTYKHAGPGLLTLAGTLDGKKVQARLRLDKKPDFLLVNRGFHWINEYPFNR